MDTSHPDRAVLRIAGLDRNGSRRARAAISAVAASAMFAVMPGCHWDSFADPSVMGRWEQTPAVVPILETLAPIESDGGALVEYTEVSLEDLQVQTEAYTISSADRLQLEIWDVITPGQPQFYDRSVDQNGYIEVPQLGRVFVSGLTEEEAGELLKRRFSQFVADPLVSVVINSRQGQSFHLQGALPGPGRYQIPSSDYRLMEALIAGGGVDPNVHEYIHVIRQISLSDDVSPNQPEIRAPLDDPMRQPLTEPADEDLIDIINDLTGDESDGDGEPSPGVLDSGFSTYQPADGPDPVVDLIEDAPPPAVRTATTEAARAAGGGRWMFLNGEWVRGFPASDESGSAGSSSGGMGSGDTPLVTQRVIRVPVRPLLAGDARYNIVVRPGDIISVPNPEIGNVYLGGQLARPGVYQIPAVGRLTLSRAVTAAGGLSGIAIPERVDLTRMVGPDRQATIMLDLRAISEGTQPDVFLKPDDHLNVGTNFWALPLAIVRNGLRASYGFGFLLDRNFGNDVFGAPPTNRGF